MPNEIKAPKAFKETIKEVYNFMKAERLMEGFDRRTVLRLILEQVTKDELDALRSAKNKDQLKNIYRKLVIKFHPDRAPEGEENEWTKSFQSISNVYKHMCNKLKEGEECVRPEVVVDETKEEMKKEKGQQGQQASQEDIKEINQFLEKTQQKYNNLYEKMKQVLEKFNNEPKAFFEDQGFINDLVSIAQALNEEQEQDLGVELKDGDLKGNIERIIAALEQIRKELLQALVKKGQLVKQNPPQPEEEKQELQENTYTRNVREAIRKTIKKAVEANPETDAAELAKTIFDLYISRDSEKINAFVQKLGGTAQSEEYNKDMSDISKNQGINWFTGTAVRYKKSLSALVATMPNGEEIQASKEDLKATFDIIKASDKFVRIYNLLFDYIKKQIGADNPNLPTIIKPTIPTPDLNKISLKKSEIKKDDDVVDDEGDNFDFAIERESFLSWYEDNKEPAAPTTESIKRLSEGSASAESMFQSIEDFEDGFITEPMLQVQSSIFASLYNFLLKLENRDFLKKFPQASTTAPRNPDEIEQTRGQKLQEEENKEGVSFEEEDIQVFKKEYAVLLELAKRLKTEVLALDLNSVETLGGAKVLDDARSIAKELQESLGRVHDTVQNELSALVGSGGTLKEAQEFDTEKNVERTDKRKANREEKGKKVIGVYKAVTGYMTKLDQLIRKNESGAIDGNDLFMYAKEAKDKLEEIKAFFPRFAPLGKMVDNPEKMFKQLKRFAKGLVRDIKDVVEQLKGITKTSPINEQAVKASTDKQTVQAFIKVLEKASTSVQDYFDAPSMIGKVKATRTPKVDNMKTAAAEGPAGDKAIEQGKAEEADREEVTDDKGGVITSVSDAMKVFQRSRTQLNKLFNNVIRTGKMNIQQSVDSQNFTFFKLLVLLKNQPKEVKEEVKADFSTQSGKHFQELGLTKEKVVVLNTLFSKHKGSNDPTITNLYYLLKSLIKNKKSISYLNQNLPKFLETSGEAYNFSLPQDQLTSLLAMKDDASDDTNTEEWQSQEFIRKEVIRAREENPDADEKEIIKQVAKEVIKTAEEAGDIPQEKEDRQKVIKQIVNKTKEISQEEDDGGETFFTKPLEEQLEKKLEKLIKHYLNNRI